MVFPKSRAAITAYAFLCLLPGILAMLAIHSATTDLSDMAAAAWIRLGSDESANAGGPSADAKLIDQACKTALQFVNRHMK